MANSQQDIIQKQTRRTQIRHYIQEQIANGRYRAGDRIVETQLAKELQVSQAPVREAILELAASGLLEEKPYSGTYVRRLTPEDVEDIYATRAFLDEYAAERAAAKITGEQLKRLEELLMEMEHAENAEEFVDKDIAFHSAILDAAGSPVLKRLWERLKLSEWTGFSVAATRDSMPDIIRQHRTIYELLEKRDAHAAGSFTYLHIRRFGGEVKRKLAEAEAEAGNEARQ